MFIKIIIIKFHTLDEGLHNIVLWNNTLNYHSMIQKSYTGWNVELYMQNEVPLLSSQ